MPRVSVVVPTFERSALLTRCLDALMMQDIAPHDFEVIIVDDADDAETRELVECCAQKVMVDGYTLRYLPVKYNHGPAAARNMGWRAAQGEIIAFTDDDCIPCPGWLNAGLAAFEDGIAGVAGRIVVPMVGIPTDYERNAALLASCEFVTANCFYRRDVLKETGGFDERFTSAWREDSDFIFTLQERKCRFASAPDAVVTHPVRPARWGISIFQQRKSMFNALLYKKHPALYRARIQAAPPWPYYLILCALAATLIGLLSGSITLLLIGLVAWLLLTLRFTLQRLLHTSHTPRHIIEMLVTSIIIPPLAIYWRLYGAVKFHVFFL